MWRRLLRRVHPDHGGEHELFVWTNALYEHVAGDGLEDARSTYQRRQPPPHYTSGSSAGERLDFTEAFDKAAGFAFADLTARAVNMAASGTVGEPYARLLRLLASCYEAGAADVTGYRSQHVGASYKQLAFIAHLAGMDASQRREWYRIAESIPLSQRHAGHLISELQARAA